MFHINVKKNLKIHHDDFNNLNIVVYKYYGVILILLSIIKSKVYTKKNYALKFYVYMFLIYYKNIIIFIKNWITSFNEILFFNISCNIFWYYVFKIMQ